MKTGSDSDSDRRWSHCRDCSKAREGDTEMNYKSVGYVRYINKQLEMLLQMHTVS